MKLELSIMAGPQTKEFLNELAGLVERLEKAADIVELKVDGFKEAKAPLKTEPPAGANVEVEDDEEDFAPPNAAKKTASFDDDDEEDEAPPVEAPAKKAKKEKAKAVTLDDVNDACLERAARSNRAEVLGILKKHFKVKSVTDLDEADYAEVIKLLKK